MLCKADETRVKENVAQNATKKGNETRSEKKRSSRCESPINKKSDEKFHIFHRSRHHYSHILGGH